MKYLVILYFLFSIPLQADWQQSGNAQITRVVALGNNTYASFIGAGVYKSSDDGLSWKSSNSGLPTSTDVLDIVTIDSLIIAGTNNGIYIFTEVRNNWIPSNSGLPQDLRIVSLAVCNGNIFAGTRQGIFRSQNYGDSWVLINSDISFATLCANDTNIVAGNDSSLFISSNNGNNWAEITPYPQGLTALTSNSKYIFSSYIVNDHFGGEGIGIFRSSDGGKSWTVSNPELPVGMFGAFVYALALHDSIVIAGTDDGIYLSKNYGDTWSKMVSGIPIPLEGMYIVGFLNVVSSSDGGCIIFADTKDGLYRLSNVDSVWAAINEGLPGISLCYNVNTLSILDSTIFAGINGGVYTSNDFGTSWVGSGIKGLKVISLSFKDNIILAGTAGSGIYVSTNHGSTWSKSDSGLASGVNIFTLFVEGNYIFAGTNNGVFRSADNGVHWSRMGIEMDYGNGVYAFTSVGLKIFAGTYGGGIYISTDKGDSWTQNNIGIYYYIVSSFQVHKGIIYAGGYGIYSSVDTGSTWKNAGTGFSWNSVYKSIAIGGNILFASSFYNLSYSSDNGEKWIDLKIPDSYGIGSIVCQGDYIFLASASGVWKRSLSEFSTSIEKNINHIPQTITLQQNYPNPFNPSTIFEYNIPVQSLVIVKIIDLLGREVATLVNEKKEAGRYTLPWNASKMASGIYFYTFQAGEFRETKRMILLK
jgi:photosystem II stability/assembly factor-like uncharacterized protein